MHTFHHSTGETGRWISELQAILVYTVRPYLKREKRRLQEQCAGPVQSPSEPTCQFPGCVPSPPPYLGSVLPRGPFAFYLKDSSSSALCDVVHTPPSPKSSSHPSCPEGKHGSPLHPHHYTPGQGSHVKEPACLPPMHPSRHACTQPSMH